MQDAGLVALAVAEGVEVAGEVEEGGWEFGEGVVLQEFGDGEAGEAADAEVILHGVFDRFGVAELEGDLKSVNLAAESTLENFAGAGTLLTQNPLGIFEICRGESGFLREWMGGRGEDHQLILAPDGTADLRVPAEPFDVADINIVVQE